MTSGRYMSNIDIKDAYYTVKFTNLFVYQPDLFILLENVLSY